MSMNGNQARKINKIKFQSGRNLRILRQIIGCSQNLSNEILDNSVLFHKYDFDK